MKAHKKSFYNQMYEEGKAKPVGGWLFNKLRCFEKYREEAVIELLPKKGEKLLDIGCGEGTFLFKLADNFKELWGVDISPVRIKRARHKTKKTGLKNIYFKIADIDQGLPLEDASFDVVTAISILEHVFDPHFVVGEIKRILKPGGVFIIEVPNIGWLPRRLDLLLGKLPRTSSETGWDGGHLHYFTQGSLTELIEDAGFDIIKVSGSGIFARLRNWYPSLLCGDLIVKAVKK